MFLPFENLRYCTKLSSEEIIVRLSEKIEPEKTFRFASLSKIPHKAYEGKIENGSFNISRIINYRNNFLPIIKGRIEQSTNETMISIKMRMHIFVIIFMVLWLGIAGLICFAILIFSNETGFTPVLISFGMFIAGYIIMTGGFKYESYKSKKYLAELFEAEPQN